jgi:acetyltransferase-like isoleucine patch superfamily enzyme
MEFPMGFRGNVVSALDKWRHLLGYLRAPLVLRLTTDRHGSRAQMVGRAPMIRNQGRIEIGKRARFRNDPERSSLTVARGAVLRLGDDVFVNQGVRIFAAQEVSIGDRVLIGDRVRIYDTNFHPTRPGEVAKVAPVVIEPDVWLCGGATVLPGARIGRGSVIGVNAVVNGEIPAGSVVAAAPSTVKETFEVPQDYRGHRPGSEARR